MSFPIELSNGLMEKALKCGICSRLLNVTPIGFKKNLGAGICGRCHPGLSFDGMGSIFPQPLYEELAACLIFPCSYQKQGCKEVLAFDDVLTHERNCSFQTSTCPLFCKQLFPDKTCTWTGNAQDIHDHLLTHTEDFLDPPQFEWPKNGTNKIFFTKVGKQIAIVVIKYEADSKFSCLVLLNGTEVESQCFKYQLELSSDDKVSSMMLRRDRLQSLLNFLDDLRIPGNILQVDIDKISDMLQNSKKIHARFGIVKKNKKQILEITGGVLPEKLSGTGKVEPELNLVDEDMLAELECPVCSEFMIPPIFICPTGHSLCSNCTAKVTSCPTCKRGLGKGRNFTLEKLTVKVKYPCANRTIGCRFISTAEKIKEHEELCNFSGTSCIFNCGWKGLPQGLCNHLKEKHLSQNIVNNSTFSKCADDPIEKDFHFITVGDQLFFVAYNHGFRNSAVRFNIYHMSELNVNPVFKYNIQFSLDENQSCPCLEMSNLCQIWTPQTPESWIQKCVNIPRALLTSYLNYTNQYYVKINITKV